MDQIAEHIIRLSVCCCTLRPPLPCRCPAPRLNTVDGVEFRGGPGDGKKDGVSLDLRGSRQGGRDANWSTVRGIPRGPASA